MRIRQIGPETGDKSINRIEQTQTKEDKRYNRGSNLSCKSQLTEAAAGRLLG